MTHPKVLILDEPTAGVSPIVMDELFDRIIEIARLRVAILMVEQNAKQALKSPTKDMFWFRGTTGLLILAKRYLRTQKYAEHSWEVK